MPLDLRIKKSKGQVQMQHQTKCPESLIKYEAEIEVSQKAQDYKKQKNTAPTLEAKPSAQDVLNAIIPPREWNDHNSKLYIQYVSHQNASREDVAKLKETLQERLKERQARESGICPIRQELFSQCFDEIIRQVTIDCPERGLLLMRTRDELKMTIAAYQTLYQSSVSFGIRKQVESEQGKPELQAQIIDLEKNKMLLEEKRIELSSKKESLEKKINQRQMIEKEKRADQIKFLQYQASNLSKFLENIKTQSAAPIK